MKRYIHAAKQNEQECKKYSYKGTAYIRSQPVSFDEPLETSAVSFERAISNFKYQIKTKLRLNRQDIANIQIRAVDVKEKPTTKVVHPKQKEQYDFEPNTEMIVKDTSKKEIRDIDVNNESDPSTAWKFEEEYDDED